MVRGENQTIYEAKNSIPQTCIRYLKFLTLTFSTSGLSYSTCFDWRSKTWPTSIRRRAKVHCMSRQIDCIVHDVSKLRLWSYTTQKSAISSSIFIAIRLDTRAFCINCPNNIALLSRREKYWVWVSLPKPLQIECKESCSCRLRK